MRFTKNLQKKFIFLLLITLFIILPIFPSYADVSSPNVYAPSCILMDLNTGKILFSKNANDKMYPASTTKVMTAILTLENCKLTDIVTVTHDAVYSVPSGYSIANLFEGEQLSVEQLLNVLLIPSANDAAFVLADYIGGSVDNFANMMNQKAEEIGCKNTHFVNPNGIQNDNHYTTAYDLALIGQYAMKNDIFRKIVSTQKYTLPATNKYDKVDRIFNTTNDLIRSNSKYYYQYATGAKTGYTEAAESCIIATAKKDNMELISIILHDQKTDTGLSTREIDCKTLFEYGFNNYSLKDLVSEGSVQKNISVSNANKDTKSLDLVVDKSISAFVPNGYNSSKVETNIVLNDNIQAPISKGTSLGTITYTIDGSDYTANLLAAHDVFPFDITKTILEIILIIVILILFTSINNHKKKRKKMASKKSKCRKSKKSARNMYYNFDLYPHI